MNWYTIYHAYVSELANGAIPHGERQSFILDYNCIIFQQLIKNHIDVTAWDLHITGPLRGESIGLQCIPCVTQMENKSLLVQVTLKRKCRHFDEILITGCTGSCHFDNFQCSQWWKFHQNEDISVSVNILTSIRQLAIIWPDVAPVHWRINAPLGLYDAILPVYWLQLQRQDRFTTVLFL